VLEQAANPITANPANNITTDFDLIAKLLSRLLVRGND
jgi:hypothetical protein